MTHIFSSPPHQNSRMRGPKSAPFHLISLFCAILFFLFTSEITSAQQCRPRDTIPLHAIQSLTLSQHEYTSSMPSKPPIKQLQCLGGACSQLPERVQCRNVGMDDTGNIQWDCSGDLDQNFSFGKVEVSCVGCGEDSRGNQLVLKGSCAAFIEVLGDERRAHRESYAKSSYYSDDDDRYGSYSDSNIYPDTPSYNENSSSFGLGSLIFILAFIFLVVMCCGSKRRPSEDVAAGRGRYPNVYPNPSAPPPDYHDSSAYDNDDDQQYGGYNSNNFGPTKSSYRNTNTSNTRNRPGFWSGLGLGSVLGGAGGYFAGSRRTRTSPRTPTYTRTRTPSPSYRSSSSTRSYSSPSSTTSSKKRTAHGFGGTTMR